MNKNNPMVSKSKSKLLVVRFIISLSIIVFSLNVDAQNENKTYQLDWSWDAPLILGGGGLAGINFAAINKKEGLDDNNFAKLNIDNVNAFDRGTAGNFDLGAEKASDLIFFAAFPYGLVLLADEKVRQEAGTIGVLYLEALTLSTMAYSSAAGSLDRYRPYTYKFDEPDNVELQKQRKSPIARNSFYAGHPSIVATSSVFVAKVYHDLHPDSNFRYVLWTVAGAASIGTAYFRVKAGKHFPTDVITGVTISSAIGFLVPHLHKTSKKDKSLSVMPITGDVHGLHLSYKF